MKNTDPWKRQLGIFAAGGNFVIGSIEDLPESGLCDASRMPRTVNAFDMLNVPPAAMATFREAYDKPEARERREAAIIGILEHGDTDLGILVAEAAAYHLRMEEEKHDLDLAGVMAMRIADRLAALVAAGDPRPFQRLAEIMKNGGPRRGEKGGKYSIDGMVFDKFCRFVCEVKKLPTKRELREWCGLTGEKGREKLFREACNRMGLAGLPTAKQPPP